MIISKITNAVQFDWGVRKRQVMTGHIKEVIPQQDNLNSSITRIFVLTDGSVADSAENQIAFDYQDVTSPVTASPNELCDIIRVWNNPDMKGQVFVASAGQTLFTTSFALASNIDVYINGVLSSTGYTWTIGSNAVTFITPFLGGEEVIIKSY